MPAEEGEELHVLDPDTGRWATWERVESFVESGPGDRHYLLDAATGTVGLGPAIRSADGGWRQYGAIPPKGASLRFSAYRYGGGRAGNVAPGALTQLKESVRRRRRGHEPHARPSAASTPSRWSRCAAARRWRCARATAP